MCSEKGILEDRSVHNIVGSQDSMEYIQSISAWQSVACHPRIEEAGIVLLTAIQFKLI